MPPGGGVAGAVLVQVYEPVPMTAPFPGNWPPGHPACHHEYSRDQRLVSGSRSRCLWAASGGNYADRVAMRPGWNQGCSDEELDI